MPYYMQAIRGQIGLLRQRVPIEEVIDDSSYDARIREQLELVLELRRFAVDEIELPDNESYTSYVDLGRDYVVWNVIAAPEFSIEARTWCFPVAGCVAYRGYFDRAKAENFAAKLESRGNDTFIGGAAAYSTLGFFDDPVLDTMLARSEAELASILFHELAHQRIYVKDDTELSESFATAVEQYAVEAWLESRNATGELAAYRGRIVRQAGFADLVARQRSRMTDVFAMAADEDRLRRAKADAYAEMRRDYEALRQSWGNAPDFDGWFEGEFNNARLVALSSYRRWLPGLRHRLDILGPGNFYLEVEQLVDLDPEERALRLEAWNEESAVAAAADRGELVHAAPQIGPDDRLHRLRVDIEGGESVFATDARHAQ